MHFLFFRYAVAAAVCLGLWGAVRLRSVKLGLSLVGTLGLLSWLFTWTPLQRPYRLQPGTEVSFDTALVSSGAATGDVLEGWVAGRRNPRPAWSFLWYVLCAGEPERARTLLPFFAPLMLILLPWMVFWLLRAGGAYPWGALCSAFTAVLASSIPLDAFAPFSLFYYGFFFASPHRSLGLVIMLASLGIAWRGGRLRLAAGMLLGVLGWLDLLLFAWGILVIALGEAMALAKGNGSGRNRAFPTLLLGLALASPQMFFLFRGDLLLRIPSREKVDAFRTAFQDLFLVSSDMEWVFLLALVAIPLLWKRGRKSDLGILSMIMASYILWLAAAVLFHLHPFSEPEPVFHLVRFSVALGAGAGGFELARQLLEHLKGTEFRHRRLSHAWTAATGKGRLEPLAFALLVVCLLPDTAPFVWRPLKMDALYYASLQEWDGSVRRLERWLLASTSADEVILTGDDTGEWIAALTGRRVWNAARVLPLEEARARRRQFRRLFLSGEPESIRGVVEATGASVLILDPSLREIYWEFDETLLESSGLFEKVHQIGDRYSIYRFR